MSKFSLLLDLETFSLRPDAIIIEIGLLIFDANTYREIGSHVLHPDIFAQLAAGRHFDPQTYHFHVAKKSLPSVHSLDSIERTITYLRGFFDDCDFSHIWIQGPDFDRPLLQNFLEQNGATLPWDYWKTRDARTLWDIAFPGQKAPPRPHTALADCRATLECMRLAMVELGRAANPALDIACLS